MLLKDRLKIQALLAKKTESRHRRWVVRNNETLTKKLWIVVDDTFPFSKKDCLIIQEHRFVLYNFDRAYGCPIYNEDDIVYFYYKAMLWLVKEKKKSKKR